MYLIATGIDCMLAYARGMYSVLFHPSLCNMTDIRCLFSGSVDKVMHFVMHACIDTVHKVRLKSAS